MQELNEKAKAFLRKLVELYRDFSLGMDQHKAKVDLGKDWIFLQRLTESRYILPYGPKYYPCFRALECLPDADRSEAEHHTDLALNAMKRAYEESSPAYGYHTLNELLRCAKALDPEITEADAKFGILMACSFWEFVLNCKIESAEDDAVRTVSLRDGILSYDSLQGAWQRQMLEIEPPRTSPARHSEFAFVADNKMRSIIERDYQELQTLKNISALKSRLILCGGLIEGLLLDALERSGPLALSSPKAPGRSKAMPAEDWKLAEMIDVSLDLGLISEGAGKLSTAARDFRNLIHPGKERSQDYVIGEAEVAGAEAALNTVIRDLRTRAKKAP